MDDNRDKDKSVKLVPAPETGQRPVSLDVVKSAYIAEGLSVEAIAERYFLPTAIIQKVVDDAKLPELRKAYIREGLAKLQNQQLAQAQHLMDIELNFKKLRIQQLEKQLEDYLAYFSRHGDFYKRHPVSGDILKDTDGIPMQIFVPNVSREIKDLKESVTLSDGLKNLMSRIDDIIHGKPKADAPDTSGVIDMDQIEGLFQKKA
jgi:hypothetical protein